MAAGCWAVVQPSHFQLQGGNTVNLRLFFLQGVLLTSLHYGCQLWVHSHNGAAKMALANLQSIYDKFLKRICGMICHMLDLMLLNGLGLSSAQVFDVSNFQI